ncbi:MAG: zinc ABC transporter substrate-binding protein [Nostocaceae cyanobacterium]|nr:zinc ABC transporter substrate-binding protein [Nostocaceae cyanobacterium]
MVLLAGCNQSSKNQEATLVQDAASTRSPQSEKIQIVTTFLPMYWFTKAVVGDAANVEILVPPGTEVHEYQATPDNVKTLATANVLVKNGLGLEEFLADTIKNAENSQLKEIDASKGIQALQETSPVEKIDTEHAHEHNHEHSSGNPHVWLDPVLVKQQVNNIRDGIIAADPKNKGIYQANAAVYIKKLDDLHNEFQQTLQNYPNCTFITFHNAYPYIAKRYQIKQVAVVEIPEDQLTPQDIQRTIDAVKKYKVKTLFGEPGVNNKLLKTLSQDLDLTLHPLFSLETGESNPNYYFQAMRDNLQSLESACK